MTTKQNDEPRTSENFKVQLDRAATEDSGILSTSQNIVDAAVEKGSLLNHSILIHSLVKINRNNSGPNFDTHAKFDLECG